MTEQTDTDIHIGAKRLKEILGNCSDMTVWRLERDPDNGFPDPLRINGRRLWSLTKIREYLASKREAA